MCTPYLARLENECVPALENAHMAVLLNLATCNLDDKIRKEAYKKLQFGSWEFYNDLEFAEMVLKVLTRRILNAPRDSELAEVVLRLMLLTVLDPNTEDSDSEEWATDWPHAVASVLVSCSDRLSPGQLHALKMRLEEDHDQVLKGRREFFDARCANLLPILGAKHPSLGVDVHKTVTGAFEYWFDQPDYDNLLQAVEQLPKMRGFLELRTCQHLCDKLSSSAVPYAKLAIRKAFSKPNRPYETSAMAKRSALEHVQWFTEAVDKALHDLSPRVVRWMRLKFKARVIGRLSLMRAESALKLYAPGGLGAAEAIQSARSLAGGSRKRKLP